MQSVTIHIYIVRFYTPNKLNTPINAETSTGDKTTNPQQNAGLTACSPETSLLPAAAWNFEFWASGFNDGSPPRHDVGSVDQVDLGGEVYERLWDDDLPDVSTLLRSCVLGYV